MKTGCWKKIRLPVPAVEGPLDTRDNARMSAAAAHRRRETGVVVTHAAHMRRSVEAFEAAGPPADPRADRLLPPRPGRRPRPACPT